MSTPQTPDRALIVRRARGPGSRYTGGDIEAALVQLVLQGGNVAQTAKRIGVTPPTISKWRDTYPERYEELRVELAPTIERTIIKNERDFALQAHKVKLQALEETADRIRTKEIRDPASALKNITIAQGISIDKALTLEGRPTQIVSHTNTDDILAELTEAGFINGTTEEDQAPSDPLQHSL